MKTRIMPRNKRNLFSRDGAWWVDIRINGRRYREIAGRTEAEAGRYRDKLKAWKRDLSSGFLTAKPEGLPLLFENVADDFLELYAAKKRSYVRDKISIGHLKDFFAGWILKDINPLAVAKYRVSRKGVSVATVNRELACLRTLLFKAVEWGKLGAYPLPSRGLLERERPFRPRIFEADEIRRLIAAAEPRWLRPAIIVWISTGMRHRELLKLRREDVDFKERTLTVVSENAKNGKARTIPISDLVAMTLKAMPERGAYFFWNSRTGTHVGDLLSSFRRACKDAGIKGSARIHDLRDTFATMALRRGTDLRTVAEIIGDDPAVALKRYCHTDQRVMREAIDRMADFIPESGHKLHATTQDAPRTDVESIN